MLKYHFFISLILFIFISCAKENYPENPALIKPEEESLTTRMTKNMDVWTDNRVINIFEEGKIRIYDKEDHADHYTTFQLDKEAVDSIVWHIDDILHYSSGVNPFRSMTGVTFYKPGEYKFNLLVYKDNKVVKKAELMIRAVPGKDFFNVDWGNPPSSSVVGQSYSYKGYRVDQTYVKKQYPYSSIDFYYENKSAQLTPEKEKEYLLEAASKTYSSPSLSAGNNGQAELDNKYNLLFKNKFNATTVAIWENRSTAVALIGYPKDNIEHYRIIGEPKY